LAHPSQATILDGERRIELAGNRLVVGGQHESCSGAPRCSAQRVDHGGGSGPVECTRWFVGQKQSRTSGQSSGYRDSLLLAA
jgi:hypothetical protein